MKQKETTAALAERKITIEWLDCNKKPKAGGIYRIWFGKRYYIGRSRCLYERRYSHKGDLNKRVNDRMGVDPFYDPKLDAFQHIIAHLKKHPRINVLKAEVIMYCDTDDQLVSNEQKWLDKSKDDRNCLNYGFIASPYREERKRNNYRIMDLRPGAREKAAIIKIKEKKEKEFKKQIRINPYAGLTSSQKLKLFKETIDRIEKDFG